MLRFTGAIEPDLYTDMPNGALPELQLFNIRNDKAELVDISSEFPQRVDELMNLYKEESITFAPPVSWSRSKW